MDEQPAKQRRQRLNRAARSQSPEPGGDPEKPADDSGGDEGGATRRRPLRRRQQDQPDIAPGKEEPKEEPAKTPPPEDNQSDEGDEDAAAKRRHLRRRHHDQHPDYVAPEKGEEAKAPSRESSRRPSKEDVEPAPKKEEEKTPPRRTRRPRRRNADDEDARSETSKASVRTDKTDASTKSIRKIPPPSEIVPADEDIDEGGSKKPSAALASAQASAQPTPRSEMASVAEEEDKGGRLVLQVVIHGTDELKAQMYLVHPVVKLSILDTEEDGKYMRKPDLSRTVVSQYENVLSPEALKRAQSRPKDPPKEKEEGKGKGKEKEKEGGEKKEGEEEKEKEKEKEEEERARREEERKRGEESLDRETVLYDRILPVMTQPFDLTNHLKEGNPLCCAWEEKIGLDEQLSHFMKHRYIFMFEVMDFIHTRENAKASLKHLAKHNGWRKIAWAFMRPNKDEDNGGGYVRTGHKVRLQLYKYKSFWFWQKGRHLQRQDTCDAWHQWKARGWKPYKATLSVTIEGILRPPLRLVQHRATMPWEREEGESELAMSIRKKEFQDKRQAGSAQPQDGALDKTRLGKKWIGATGKWCRVPNAPMHKLESDYRGCFVLAFSTFGTFLACAVAGHRRYKIRIFNVANGSEVKTLDGHYEIVYDMQWGMEREESLSGLEEALTGKLRDEERGGGAGVGALREEEEEGREHADKAPCIGPLLVSASADTTARVWNVEDATLVASCHHPSYVYAARFCPGPDGVKGETQLEKAMSGCQFVVTGCYDSNLRLWDVRPETVGDSAHAQIVKLVEGHLSHINSLVLDASLSKLYSADGIGVIRVWSMARHSFDLIKEVAEPEVKGDAINCLRLDRSGRRLALLARDNMVRMMDTERWQITHRFSGLRSSLHQIRCDLSPDGKFLMSGSEDGQVFVWNTDTGEQDTSVPRERRPHMRGLVTDVAWNPAERIIACCSFSRKHPVMVHKYEREADSMAVEEMAEDEVRDVLQGQFSELAEAFKRMDKSGDGKLQLDEFRDGVMSLESDVTEMQIFRMFKTIAGGTDEIELDEFIRRFAPAGTAEEIRTNTAIEKARRRHSQSRDTTTRKAATLGLLEELSDTRRRPRVDGGGVGEPTGTGHRRQLPPMT